MEGERWEKMLPKWDFFMSDDVDVEDVRLVEVRLLEFLRVLDSRELRSCMFDEGLEDEEGGPL